VTASLILPNLCGLCPDPALGPACVTNPGTACCFGRGGSMGRPSCLLLCVCSPPEGCPGWSGSVTLDPAYVMLGEEGDEVLIGDPPILPPTDF
jgi:hypothetical protein